jgi:hypothetical protein
MSAHHEDGPPNAPARQFGSNILDRADALCMAQRRARARHAIQVIGSCKCGRPVYRDGLCTGCHEDRFYSAVRRLPAEEQFE